MAGASYPGQQQAFGEVSRDEGRNDVASTLGGGSRIESNWPDVRRLVEVEAAATVVPAPVTWLSLVSTSVPPVLLTVSANSRGPAWYPPSTAAGHARGSRLYDSSVDRSKEPRLPAGR